MSRRHKVAYGLCSIIAIVLEVAVIVSRVPWPHKLILTLLWTLSTIYGWVTWEQAGVAKMPIGSEAPPPKRRNKPLLLPPPRPSPLIDKNDGEADPIQKGDGLIEVVRTRFHKP